MSHPNENEKLKDLLSRAADLQPQPDFDQWKRQYPEAVNALESRPSVMANQRRKDKMIRFARYGATAAAVTLLTVAGVWWLVVNQGATSAFADVIEQLGHVKNVTCQMRCHMGGDEVTFRLHIQGSRVRIEEPEVVNVLDFDKNKMLEAFPRSKEARISDVTDREDRAILASNPLDDLLKMKDANSRRLGKERIGDTECHVYGFDHPVLFLDEEFQPFRLWVDQKTNLPVQLHAVIEDGIATITFTDFKWNQRFDESLFRLAVPDGYELVEERKDENASPERQLPSDDATHDREGRIQEEEIARIADTLEMLGQKTEANYNAITSWSGTYKLTDRTFWRKYVLADRKETGPVWLVSNVLVTFSIDATADRIRTDYKQTEPTRILNAETDQPLTTSSSAREYRWLGTLEHFFRFPVDSLRDHVEGFPHVEGFGGPGRRGRILHREGPRAAEMYDAGDKYVDPRTFYGTGVRVSWRKCFLYANALRGERSSEEHQHAKENARLTQRQNGDATEYVLTIRHPDPAVGTDRLVQTMAFLSKAGFNLVSYTMVSSGQPHSTLRCSFREKDGVFIPSEYEYRKFKNSDVDGAYLIRHRHFTLKDVRVNETLDPAVFEIEHLGLRYGDRMVDRIENRLMVFDGERFVPAEKFKLQPDLLPSESDGSSP